MDPIYIDVDTSKYQYRMINPTLLYCITGYIMEDFVGDRYLKRLTHRRLNSTDGYISSYLSIHNSPERFDEIKKANKLVSVIGNI